MDLDRRSFLTGAGLLALATVGAATARRWAPAMRAAAPALRPVARGSSGRVCAQCGAAGHSALDARCPAQAEGRAVRLAAARSRAAAARGGLA